jgi:hypothetical protein
MWPLHPLFWVGAVAADEATPDRGDYGPSHGGRKKRPQAYTEQKKLYYRQLQAELDRQLEAREPEPAPETVARGRKQRRIVTEAVPPPVLTEPPMIAGEASRLIAQFLETQAAMKRAAMDRELMRMAEEMARQQDEDDAVAVLMAVL